MNNASVPQDPVQQTHQATNQEHANEMQRLFGGKDGSILV